MARAWLTRKPTCMDGRATRSGLVIVRDSDRSAKGDRWFFCRCPLCEKEFEINTTNIHKQKSCGCAKRDEYGIASFKSVLSGYKRSAADRGYSWEISDDDFRTLTKANCHYCGIEPRTRGGQKNDRNRDNGLYLYNGLDRVDTAKGYVASNVVTCCWFCNRAKNQMTIAQWDEWSERFVEYQSKRVK